MIFCLLAVGTIAHFLTVKIAVGDSRRHAERNSLVCRPKEHVKIIAVIFMDGPGIILSQFLQLRSGHIGTCIHKKRGFPAALKRKVPKFQRLAVHHELNKLFLIVFHPVLSPCPRAG